MDTSHVNHQWAEDTTATDAVNNLMFLSRHTPQTTDVIGSTVSAPSFSVLGTERIVKVVKCSFEESNNGFKAYRCSECQFTDDHVSDLYKHMASAHKGFAVQKLDGSLSCMDSIPEVGQVISASKTLDQSSEVIYVFESSITSKVNGGKLYRCSACDYASDSTSNVYKHMKNMHRYCVIIKLDGTILHKAVDRVPADSGVESNRSLASSIDQVVRVYKATKEEIARGIKMYKCSACGKSSNATSNLYRHMECVHKGCRIERINQRDGAISRGQRIEANAALTTGTNKIVRIVKSSEDEMARGAKQYTCSECGKSSNCTGNLYAHMDISHPECVVQLVKPYNHMTAPLNSVNGSTNNVVKVIVARHNGNVLYKCSQCCMVSTSTSNLYKHMRRQHKGFVIVKKVRKEKLEKTVKKVGKKKACCSQYGHMNNDNDKSNNSVGREVEMDVEDDDMEVDDHESNEFAVQSYECSVCMEVFSNCRDLDIHVKLHEIEYYGDGSSPSDDCDDVATEEEEESDAGQLEDDGDDGAYEEDRVENRKDEDVAKQRGDDESEASGGKNYTSIGENVDEGKGEDSPSLVVDTSRPSFTVLPKIRQQGNQNSNKTVTIVKTSLKERARGGKMYPCPCCGETSDFLSNLYTHIEKEHEGFQIQKITTNIFPPPTSVDSSSRRHELEVETEKPANPAVSMSGSSEKIVTALVTLAAERMKGSKRYQCSECGLGSDCTSNLYKHMKSAHSGFVIHKIKEAESKSKACQSHNNPESIGPCLNDIVQSVQIPQSVSTKDISISEKIVNVIVATKAERMKGSKRYQCSECGLGSNFTSNLYKHMRSAHRGFVIHKIKEAGSKSKACQNYNNPESISSCSNDFVQIRKIPQSSPLNEAEYNFQCSKCGFESSALDGVYSHIRNDHRGCVIQRAKGLERLLSPSLQEDGDNNNIPRIVRIIKASIRQRMKGVKMYRCSLCPYANDSTSNLYKHMRSCHAEFVIEKLNVTNRQGYEDLSGHDSEVSLDGNTVRVIKVPKQGGEPLYKCSQCGRTSNSTGNLYKHMRRSHPMLEIVKMFHANSSPATDGQSQNIPQCLSDNEGGDDDYDGISINDIVTGGGFSKPIDSYECCVCMETFSTRDDLDAHTFAHHL